jgi:glycosyltransferase involved in cell wall biosynthesis
MFFSIIIPVYNRPLEIRELLQSLLLQDSKDFEVVVVEDGSSITCEEIIKAFSDQLTIIYNYVPNAGQGFARNKGMQIAKGDYFVFFDSDCVIPAHYLEALKAAIENQQLNAHGGPDSAADSFTDFQKALDYSMTSRLTTGGIRGKLKDAASYEARGYNMGLSRTVFQTVGGFVDPNKGEDIELSIRIKKAGFRLELVQEAYVYHKRKNTLLNFYKQSFSFGQNRINVSRFHPKAVKVVHILPLLFLLGWLSAFVLHFLGFWLGTLGLVMVGLWLGLVSLDAIIKLKSLSIGLLSPIVAFGQLSCYGAGFLSEWIKKTFSAS